MERYLEKLADKLVGESLGAIRSRPRYRDAALEELGLHEKKKLWEMVKYAIAPPLASWYGKRFPEIQKVWYGDIAAGQWVGAGEGGNEGVTGADLDLLMMVSDLSVGPAIGELTQELDAYFLEALRRVPFAAERLGPNFLELHLNDVYARQAERDEGSCGAQLVYDRAGR